MKKGDSCDTLFKISQDNEFDIISFDLRWLLKEMKGKSHTLQSFAPKCIRIFPWWNYEIMNRIFIKITMHSGQEIFELIYIKIPGENV